MNLKILKSKKIISPTNTLEISYWTHKLLITTLSEESTQN